MDLDKSGDVTFMEVLQAVFPMASRQQIKVTALAVPGHSVWAAQGLWLSTLACFCCVICQNMIAYTARQSPVAKKKEVAVLTAEMVRFVSCGSFICCVFSSLLRFHYCGCLAGRGFASDRRD